MAKVIIFPDQDSFDRAHGGLSGRGIDLRTVETPGFCAGLVPPSIVTTGNVTQLIQMLALEGVEVSGVAWHGPLKRQVPDGPAPDPIWREITGDIRMASVRPSLTDPTKLRVEVLFGKSLESLIPMMARLIKGGTYNPGPPVLAFEEEHRLLVFSPERLVISRSNDLLDAWIMLRSAVDLICLAWTHRSSIIPESEPRLGIGPTEIFKRLPGTGCRMCGASSCMEFAMGLFTGKREVDECGPLADKGEEPRRESLLWFLWVLGRENKISQHSQECPDHSTDSTRSSSPRDELTVGP